MPFMPDHATSLANWSADVLDSRRMLIALPWPSPATMHPLSLGLLCRFSCMAQQAAETTDMSCLGLIF